MNLDCCRLVGSSYSPLKQPILMETLPIPSIVPVNTPSTILVEFLSSNPSLIHLKQVHARILRTNQTHNRSLLKFLLSSTSLNYAVAVFSNLSDLLIPHLSAPFLRHLSRSSEPNLALSVYGRLRKGDAGIDRFMFPPLLKAVARVSSLAEGKEIHGLVAKFGFDSDPFVMTGLVGMYAACGRISDSRQVFDRMSYRDVVAWSTMIAGYCQNELFDEALRLFDEMKDTNVQPDQTVLSTILSACGRTRNIYYGKAVHEYLIEKNNLIDLHLRSALVTMYASCGCMDLAWQLYDQMEPKSLVVSTAMLTGFSRVGQVNEARSIFDKIIEKDLVCWSAMISGYSESDQPQEALRLFMELQTLQIKPDQVTMLSVISACGHLGVLNQAKWIHGYIDRNKFRGAVSINNALIDMYAKCGSLECAREIFESMGKRNVITWTTMIHAFGMHGDANSALSYFQKMKLENIQPNEVTFVGLLYACSHVGLVEEGKGIFKSMVDDYGIIPKHEHYGCMVDLLGRAKCLRKALELVESMPLAPNVIIWGSLVAACRVHRDAKLGEFAARKLLQMEPDHDGALVLLSNIYAKERRWEDVGEIRRRMKEKGIFKERGYSRIELNNKVHEFLIEDRKHEQTEKIYEKLEEVVGQLKLAGYKPNTCSVLVDLEEEEKKEAVLWHSEKLALCFGLLNGEEDACIHIVKNLRVCEDCHSFLKLASKVYRKEIVVRDRTRFHHYKDGMCSCKDYW